MAENTQEQNSNSKNLVVILGLLVVFIIAVALTVKFYNSEASNAKIALSEEGSEQDFIDVAVKLLTVDPVKGDITARFELIPQGAFAKEDGSAAQDIKFYVNSANGKQTHTFKQGERINPFDTTISMYDGVATDYPFDKHQAGLEFYFTAEAKKEPPKPAEGAPEGGEAAPTPTPAPAKAEEKEETEVPLAVDLYGSIPGLNITATKAKESDETYMAIDLTVVRSGTTKLFSFFVMFLMWAMSLGVAFMVLSIVLGGRKVELAMFSFMAALLFAFTAMRNGQPGVPPIGTYSDFISFFWAEIIIALCLLTALITWLLRPAK